MELQGYYQGYDIDGIRLGNNLDLLIDFDLGLIFGDGFDW